MKKPSKVIRKLIAASLAVCSISSPLADDLDSAAELMFANLKFAKQPMQPSMPQGPAPAVPPEFMPPPAGAMPTEPMQAPSGAPAVPPEFTPAAIVGSNGPSAATPAAPQDASEDDQPATVSLDDGSAPLPADEAPDASAGTGDAGTNDGSVGPTGN